MIVRKKGDFSFTLNEKSPLLSDIVNFNINILSIKRYAQYIEDERIFLTTMDLEHFV